MIMPEISLWNNCIFMTIIDESRLEIDRQMTFTQAKPPGSQVFGFQDKV
ncbi:MAG: hypothetical protein CM1200mP22_25060 [Dehalococcoidia bacterium]|nr:MAG: hypothetical protein CM1200mP22_25060 [Dehalococcoidia bacterium]